MNENNAPIFVTGSVRSGTSIVRDALVHGAGIVGNHEGCFLDILGICVRMIDRTYHRRSVEYARKKIDLIHVPQESLKQDLAKWFKDQYEMYMPYTGTWVDKTPDNDFILAIPYIHMMWPRAKYIFLKRRPIDNMMSRIRKFPHRTFEQQCLGWTKIIEDTEIVKKQIPQSAYIEIDQYDIAIKPEEVAIRLGVFLNLSQQQIAKIQHMFMEKRPEFTGGNEKNIISLDETPWTDEQKKYFLETCGTVVRYGGWSLGKTYYAE